MEPSLTQYYDSLKARTVAPMTPRPLSLRPGPNGEPGPGVTAWKMKAAQNCDALKDQCCKHLVLDIYAKILPLDQSYIDGHQGQISQDVDAMLAAKNMTPTQYLTSCSKSTPNSTFAEYLMWATDKIGEAYMEKADKSLKDAQELDSDVSAPPEPDINDDEVQSQLVDVKSDMEYENFVDELKKKTIDKIVNDISNIIDDKKDEADMTFNTPPTAAAAPAEPAQESVVGECLNFAHHNKWAEGADLSEEVSDQLICMAIREAALHELDCVFEQPRASFKEYASAIRFNKGYIVNENSIRSLFESAGVTTKIATDESKKKELDILSKMKDYDPKQKAPSTVKVTIGDKSGTEDFTFKVRPAASYDANHNTHYDAGAFPLAIYYLNKHIVNGKIDGVKDIKLSNQLRDALNTTSDDPYPNDKWDSKKSLLDNMRAVHVKPNSVFLKTDGRIGFSFHYDVDPDHGLGIEVKMHNHNKMVWGDDQTAFESAQGV